MTDLVEFLRARLDEDEQTATKTLRAYQHVFGITHYFPANHDSSVAMTPRVALAEVEAKRRIIDLHGPEDASPFYDVDQLWVCAECGPDEDVMFRTKGRGNYPCPTLRLLAQPYADHEAFQHEWRIEPH